ncbi:hypothetical protein PVAND_012584 [Polypedilum vanderplanki]|uniref:Uncharacterized protein n=1 Tax=Polypedilum vanderplanki TaxID=319348 RepID=A0A9J6CM31_POLVA|nr:hypothetical protein PVAND_012584 [Polypedilum vanderplanki]
MKILIIFLLFIQQVFCIIDIDDKCPEFREPIEDFNVNDILDKQWFVLEMVVHYQGNTPINEFVQENVKKFFLNISGIENEIDVDNTKFKVIDQVLILWNSTITNKSFIKLDISVKNAGRWTNNETNIEVMYTNENITILTFCDSDRLFSLVLTNNDDPYTKENYELADTGTEIFKQYSINVEAIKLFSAANIVEFYSILLWFCVSIRAF